MKQLTKEQRLELIRQARNMVAIRHEKERLVKAKVAKQIKEKDQGS